MGDVIDDAFEDDTEEESSEVMNQVNRRAVVLLQWDDVAPVDRALVTMVSAHREWGLPLST